MDTSYEKRTRRRTRWTVAAVCALALVGYPLSLGPAVWLVTRGYLPGESQWYFTVLYAPLASIARTETPPGELLDWYARLWQSPGL